MDELCLISLRRDTDEVQRLLASVNDKIRRHFAGLSGGVAPAERVALLAKLERLHRTCEWAEQDVSEAIASLATEIAAQETKMLVT